ncbi:GntR family transcriptional regulator [Cryobacterium sp. Hh7]|uniref:GntR family transcriptional regulator n=1 Tax=Cryobacterium sp. Hh7 TaxID=1259159 RepID=UPI00106901DD|nr:GntR family transcriptional regulator [Cryobacterium sp. Hh7]TFD52684.1 GntR family transcriptional regulator [Cryobacterium sp. Hh7]
MVRQITVTSVVDAVGDDIRRRLFAGELPGGSALTEVVVSEEYAVSRSTAKAAIEKLSTEGLLQRGAHKTARVPLLSSHDVFDIYRTRQRLESQAVRELATERRVPRSATEANERVRATGTGPAIESVEPDLRFHTALVNGLDSPRLERMYASLVDEVRLCMAQVQGRSLLSVEQIAAEHHEILDRIGTGDAAGAVECLTSHLGRASERLAQAITEQSDGGSDSPLR